MAFTPCVAFLWCAQSRAHANYLYPDRAHDDHLDWFKHRQPLALKEMLHWSPDIICAQEVGGVHRRLKAEGQEPWNMEKDAAPVIVLHHPCSGFGWGYIAV
eukprot:1161850-Pelagomonas_calceolata.AAC.1